MKKIIIGFILIVILLITNQIIYLTKVQFICESKINSGKELNQYEIFSALQTHSMFWLVGWIVEPNTALACFNKQFHTSNSIFSFSLPDDDSVIKSAKKKLLNKDCNRVRLAWKNYTSKASIYLNGSYLSIYVSDSNYLSENNDGNDIYNYLYEITCDYKPGTINICGITIVETVFDYLENKNILSVYTEHRFQKVQEK